MSPVTARNAPPALRPGLDILVVDDEANIRRTLSLSMELDGHRVQSVGNVRDALALLGSRHFDMVFLDIRLGTEKGTDHIGAFSAASPWTRIVVMTAYASVETAVESLKLGAIDYLPKPFTPAQIRSLTARVAETRVADPLSGSRSPAMQRVLAQAKQLSAAEAPVLIQGEPGSGRSSLARFMEAASRRAPGTFGSFICASYRPEAVDAELFGAAPGALAGLPEGGSGRILEHTGGTLLLEGVEDLPLSSQSRLSRFLRDREIERVGENVLRRADTRILATTGPDLERRVQQGGFRADLNAAFAGFRLAMPPLRERKEDILPLALSLLSVSGAGKGRKLMGFSESAESSLLAYAWPGNIRELRDVVERAVILTQGQQIGAAHLGLPSRTGEESIALGDAVSLDRVEEAHIRKVLSAAKSLDEASRILGIDAATLWRRRKKYGL